MTTSTADRAAFKPGDRVRVKRTFAEWAAGRLAEVEGSAGPNEYGWDVVLRFLDKSHANYAFAYSELEPAPHTPTPKADPYPTDRWAALASALDAYDAGQCPAGEVIRAAHALVRPLAPLAEDREAGKPALATTGGENADA